MFGNSNDANNQQDNNNGFSPPSAPPSDFGDGGLNLPAPPDSPSASPALPPSNDDHAALNDLAASTPDPDPAPAQDPTPTETKSDDLLDSKDSDLLDIKQKALQHLSPLVGHLEQSSEEKFRTLMMM